MIRKVVAFILAAGMLVLVNAPFAAAEKVGYVASTGLYVRKSPSSSATALRCAKNGEKLVILKEQGDWYYVKYNDVVSGYVAKKFVSSKKPGGGTASAGAGGGSSSASGKEALPARISDIGVPNATRVGDRGSDVTKLQQALKLVGCYSGSVDGVFGEGTERAVKKYQQSKGLSADGIAGNTTIKTLFGSSNGSGNKGSATASSSSGASASSSVEKLDWTQGGRSVIPAGAFFEIKDVRTGIKFRAHHLYGSSHLDAEPATRDDTAKMLQMYGGSWSWNRRAVLLRYNGRVLAASMNGMPHGESSISGNNFDGQFCIHFLNSKTHGSSKVDPDHQARVNEAAKSSW
ncbi:MAG: peptidoglycan-binding protein [Clostridia bacterium]|nr:peptidoglycan-binding protein [Clostridia bacterium]